MASASSHFFIEQNALGSQDLSTQGFGPVSDSIFRITSKFTLGASKRAFSVCKGVVLLQPQDGTTDKVNLILRPFVQPVRGLNIKYFIYRGLVKADFVTNDPDPLVVGTGGTPSDFIVKINGDFNSFHQEAPNTTVPFTAKFIGFDPSHPPATPISDFFFKESAFIPNGANFDEEDAYELPMIGSGKSLGRFAAGECGIDVVLDYGDYKHDFDNGEFSFDLEYARAAAATITVSGNTIADFRKREHITQFLDIAAFYGCHTEDGTVSVTDASNTVSQKTGLQIYNDLLTPFATKNAWYIYVQGDRARSYDFYGNHKLVFGQPENMKKGNTDTTLTDAGFQTQKWPLLINTETHTPPLGDVRNKLYIQFVTDNNKDLALYGQYGKIDNAQQNNFCNADDLMLPDTGLPIKLTKVIAISTPSVTETVNKNVTTVTLLHYRGLSYGYISGEDVGYDGSTTTLYSRPDFFDDVFFLIKSRPLLKTDGNTPFSKTSSSKLSVINLYFDRQQQGIVAVQTLTVNDSIATGNDTVPMLARTTYLTETVDFMGNTLSAVSAPTADTKTSPSASGTVGNTFTYELEEPYRYATVSFTDDTDVINGVVLKTTDGSVPQKILLGLSKTENDALITLVDDDTKNPRLFLIDLNDGQVPLVSTEGVPYQKYKVVVVAENTDGKCEMIEPPQDIVVYAIDRNCYFSKEYSQYITDSATVGVKQSPNY